MRLPRKDFEDCGCSTFSDTGLPEGWCDHHFEKLDIATLALALRQLSRIITNIANDVTLLNEP